MNRKFQSSHNCWTWVAKLATFAVNLAPKFDFCVQEYIVIYSFPIIQMNFRLIILEMELNDSFVSVDYTVQQCVLK